MAVIDSFDYIEDYLGLLHHHLVAVLALVWRYLAEVFGLLVGFTLSVVVAVSFLGSLLLPFFVHFVFLLVLVLLLV